MCLEFKKCGKSVLSVVESREFCFFSLGAFCMSLFVGTTVVAWDLMTISILGILWILLIIKKRW